MKQTTITSIEKFLAEITSKSDIDVIGLVTIADIDTDNPYESICEQIRDNNGFDIEIIYYSNAIIGLTTTNDLCQPHKIGNWHHYFTIVE